MALLQDILFKVNIRSVDGVTAVDIKDLQIDSRTVTEGSVFIAIKGSSADGHRFIDTAIINGAKSVICETLPSERKEGVTYVQVENSAAAAGYMAHNCH